MTYTFPRTGLVKIVHTKSLRGSCLWLQLGTGKERQETRVVAYFLSLFESTQPLPEPSSEPEVYVCSGDGVGVASTGPTVVVASGVVVSG